MPDENKPGDGATEVEDPVATQLAEIEKMKEGLEADRQALAQERQQTQELNQTISALNDAIRQPAPQEEPAPRSRF